jgi:capsular polysaccharide biosynthesis protein
LAPDLSLADFMAFAERHWRWVLAGAALLVALALAVELMVLGPTYSSSATLVVVPPKVQSELAPAVMTVHGYQNLLESDAVLLETHRRLLEKEVIGPEDRLKLGRNLDSRIFVSRRQETTFLSPMIEAQGRAEVPEKAAAMANIWADVFLEQVRDLKTRTTSLEIEFIEGLYPVTRQELEEKEHEWLELAEEYQGRRKEIEDTGDRRIAGFNKETSSLIANHRVASRKLIGQAVADAVAQMKAGPEAAQNSRIFDELSELAGIRSQMAQMSEIVVLEKAITDDVLWQSLSQEKEDRVSVSRPLQTQEINQVYSELALRGVAIEGELERLAAADSVSISQTITDLQQLQIERSADLARLKQDRALGLALLRRKTQSDLEALERERELRMRQIQREINRLREVDQEMAINFGEAFLAKAQENLEAVYLAAPAGAIPVAEPRHLVLKAGLSAVIGGLAGLIASLLWRFRNRSRAAA